LVAAHGLDPGSVTITAITTTGDRIRDRPLAEIGGKGLFTKEIEEALRAGAIDIAVHSMKDMPSELADGLMIGAVPPREDPRDALVSPVAQSVDGLPAKARVGSSSIRRASQLRRVRPDLDVVPFRGNVGTRLAKLEAGEVQATLLACAGLRRLGLADAITAAIAIEEMLPAPAQGALCVQIRRGDERVRALVAALDDPHSAQTVTCERTFLGALEGSCRTPIAGHARIVGGVLHFDGEALTPDGSQTFGCRRQGSPADADALGRDAGEEVRRNGGASLQF
ncbi:MAG: hydroxymethylbilane synthase, partial [Pseudomonadota bacterium]|nr:hydroxymethylbilane synthase [Pseudomonadota bacterium]